MIEVNPNYSQEFSIIPFCEGSCIFQPLSKKLLLRGGSVKPRNLPKDVKTAFFSYSLKFEENISKIWNMTMHFLENNPETLKMEISDVFPSLNSAIELSSDKLEEILDGGCGMAPLGTVMSSAHMLLLIKYGSNEAIPQKFKFIYEYIDNYTKAIHHSIFDNVKTPAAQNLNTPELSAFVKTFTRFGNFTLLNDVIQEYRKKKKKLDKFPLTDVIMKAELDFHGLESLIPMTKNAGDSYVISIGTAIDITSSIALSEHLNLYSLLGDIKLTRKDVEQILNFSIYSEKTILEKYTKEDFSIYSFAIIIKMFCIAYKSAKKDHENIIKSLKKAKGFDSEEENPQIILLQKQLANIKADNEELKQKVFDIKTETEKKFLQEIRVLNKKYESLQKENYSLLKSKEELNALREFFFKMEHEYEPVNDTRSLTEVIQGKKIVVIGGPEPWLNRMRPLYPEIKFLSGESNSLNIEVVQGADHVFIYSSHLTHSLYYRIMKICKNRGVQYSYLGYRQNPEFIESEMIESLLD